MLLAKLSSQQLSIDIKKVFIKNSEIYVTEALHTHKELYMYRLGHSYEPAFQKNSTFIIIAVEFNYCKIFEICCLISINCINKKFQTYYVAGFLQTNVACATIFFIETIRLSFRSLFVISDYGI